METNGLTLVVQESNIGTCIQVRANGGMAGGCGDDLDEPLGILAGGIGSKTFASGWAPLDTVIVEMVFGGETVTVTDLQTVPGYDLVFFVVSPIPPPGNEPTLPDKAVAYDAERNHLATVRYDN